MNREVSEPQGSITKAVPVVGGSRPALAMRHRPWAQHTWHALRRDPRGLAGLAITLTGITVAVFAPVLAPADPTAQNLSSSLRAPSWLPDGAPGHPLGTDQLGRDVLSRIMYGTRISLSIGLLTVAISAPVGTLIGLLAGYYGGWLEDLFMRLADAQLAIPFLLLVIAIVAVLGPSAINIILVLGLASWVVYARVVRVEVLSLKGREFIEAARVIGASDARIITRHVLPNTLVSVGVLAAFAVAHMILVESSLSFLGLGVPPPTPSWGGMVGDSRDYLMSAWWLPVFPGLAIAVTVLGINFLGDWLRDILDPRLKL